MAELWDLWMRWLDGRQLTGVTLWGWPLFLWGRVGKASQFLAALTVVLDLVGPEALRGFGRRLTGISWSRARQVGRSVLAVIVAILVLSLPVVGLLAVSLAFMEQQGQPVPDLPRVPGHWPLIAMGLFLALWGAAALAFQVTGRATGSEALAAGFVHVPEAFAYVLTALCFWLPWALICGLCVPLLRGTAFLLDRARPAHPARVVAAVLFIIGFHFDFLAS